MEQKRPQKDATNIKKNQMVSIQIPTVFSFFFVRHQEYHVRMTTISEDADSDDEDEEMEFSTMGNQVN